MHPIKTASRHQSFFQPANGDPVMVEFDRILAKLRDGKDATPQELGALDRTATSCGVPTDPEVREQMFHDRLTTFGKPA